MPRAWPIGLSLLTLALVSPARARPTLPSADAYRLAHYEVLGYGDPIDRGLERGKAIALFDATPDEVFRVATDYDKFSQYAPRVTEARVVDRQGEAKAQVLLATDLPWPVSRAWCQVQFEHERLGRDAYRIRFYQLRGSMRRYEGSVLIEPWQRWKGGGTSTVTYELVAVPDSSAPKSWINRQVRDAAVKWVHYLRQRINSLRWAGRLHPTQPADPHLDSPLDGRKLLTPVTEVAKAR